MIEILADVAWRINVKDTTEGFMRTGQDMFTDLKPQQENVRKPFGRSIPS
jgi:hypothetical protein